MRPAPGDEVVTDKGLTVLVDRKASLFLIGTVMDYEVKALSAGLHLHQPERKGPLRLRRELPRLSGATAHPAAGPKTATLSSRADQRNWSTGTADSSA